MQDVIEKVIAFADKAHGSQTRRYTDDRYIVHPIRVMETCKVYTDEISVLAAAILHDVLEDTHVSKESMTAFLQTVMTDEQAAKTIGLVVELTDVFVKESFPKWNRRKRKQHELDRLEKTSAEAQTIKYADIMDNAPEVAEKDPDFGQRFLRECRALLKRMKLGNAELHQKAVESVEKSFASLKRRH